MRIEEALRDVLSRRVQNLRGSENAWSSIERRIDRRRLLARSVTAVVALLASFAALMGLWSVFGMPGTRNGEMTSPSSDLNPHVTATISVGPSARGLSVGPEGVWVTTTLNANCGSTSGAISMIDPATNRVELTIPLDIVPEKAADGFGSLWVGGYVCQVSQVPDHGAAEFEAVVARVDPSTNKVTAVIPVGSPEVFGLAAGEGGVWVTTGPGYPDSGEVVRVDATLNNVAARIPINRGVTDVVVGNGGVWISALNGRQASESGLLHLDPATNDVRDVPIPGIGGSAAIGDGAVWAGGTLSAFETSAVEGQLAAIRIDPNTMAMVGTPIGLEDTTVLPFAVGEGGLWFLGGRREAAINRLNAETLQVDQSVVVGNDWALEAALDPSAEIIWVVDEIHGSITRVDLN